MQQRGKTTATKRVVTAVALASLGLAGAGGGLAAESAASPATPAGASTAGVEYFVATNGADAGNDGKSWKQPFLTIGKALEQPDVTIVTVAHGTYSITAEIAVSKAVTIRSFGHGVYGGLAKTRNYSPWPAKWRRSWRGRNEE